MALFMAIHPLHQHSWVVVTQTTVWPAKPRLCTFCPFMENCADPRY